MIELDDEMKLSKHVFVITKVFYLKLKNSLIIHEDI